MAESKRIEQEALNLWRRLCWQYRTGIVLRVLLLLATIWLVLDGIFRLLPLGYGYIIPVFVLLGAGAVWLGRNRLQLGDSISHYLNHRYSWLEFSTQLIPRSPDHPLEQLQRQRVLQTLVANRSTVAAWPDLRILLAAFLGITLIYAAVRVLPVPGSQPASPARVNVAALPPVPEALAGQLPRISDLQIQVQPPAYTRQAAWSATEPILEAPEGSQINWLCYLDGPADSLLIVWNGRDTVLINPGADNTYAWQTQLNESRFYQIRYGRRGNWFTSPVYTLHAMEDRPPVITVEAPAPYTLVLYGQQPQVGVELSVADEYGLNRARLVATVSRGSGESVKFREVALDFTENIAGKKSVNLRKVLDFGQLQMEPGDELYFHAEAWDQAKPPQLSRSDTYFVQWEDTTSEKLSVTAGIALDNMPAYFRSQRQIIIDTEKLIAEQKHLNKSDFQQRSNDLGVDQKVLRLRYGQFLGEEFETSIGGAPHDHAHYHDHDHDHEGHDHEHHDHHGEHHDHGHSQEPRNEPDRERLLEGLHDHGSGEAPAVFGQSGDMLRSYQHRHDSEESATFFDEALKAQLRAALAQMWEAELRLRTLRPEEALPYEYKALELIKEIQQKSRVYVERVGFTPPPLKPDEKRLSGDLDEVQDPKRTWEAKALEATYPHLRRAVPVLEKLRTRPDQSLTPEENRCLEEAGAQLAALVLEQPGVGVQALNGLNQLISGEKLPADAISRLQRRIIRLLPPEPPRPGAERVRTEPEMDRFVEGLIN